MSPAASEEYYQLLVSSESHGCGADVPSCTVGEIARAASEFILKNAVSVPPCRPAPAGASPRPCWRPGGQSSSVDLQEVTSFLKKKKVKSGCRRLLSPAPATSPRPRVVPAGGGETAMRPSASCPGLRTQLVRL